MKIKPNEIEELKRHRETDVWGTLHTQQKTADDYYELKNDFEVPEALGGIKKRLKVARDLVDAGPQNYTTDNPKAVVPPRGRSEKAREQAGTLETFYNAWLDHIVMQINNNCTKTVLRGGSIWQLWIDDFYYGVDKEKWTDDQKRDFSDSALSRFPLKVFTPDFINCYPSLAMQTNFQPVDMIMAYPLTIQEAEYLASHNNWKWKANSKNTNEGKVELISYTNNDDRCVLIDKEPVFKGGAVKENIMGFCPFIIVPSGYGQESYEGNPETKYRSILYPHLQLIELGCMAISQIYAIVGHKAYPQKEVIGSMELVKQVFPNGIPTNPNEALVHPPEIEIKDSQGVSIQQELLQWYAIVNSIIGAPMAMMGQAQTGVYSGTHNRDMLAYEKSRYKRPFKNIEDGLAEFLGMGARAIEDLGNEISVRDMNDKSKSYGDIKTIKPSDIDGYYYCKVKLQADLPEATDIRKNMGATFLRQGTLSQQTVLTDYFDMSIEEAEREADQMSVEAFLHEPTVRQVVAVAIAQEWGMDELLNALKTLGLEGQRGGDHRKPQTVEGMAGVPKYAERAESSAGPEEMASGNIPLGMQ